MFLNRFMGLEGYGRDGRYVPRFVFLVVVLGVGITGLLYGGVLGSSFILDDFVWLDRARLAGQDPLLVFETFVSNFFRPLLQLVFTGLLAAAGPEPLVFHLANIVVHALCAAALALLVLTLFHDALAAVLAALVFLLLPTHDEAVVWISALSEPLLTLMVLLCATFWARSLAHGTWAPGSYILALCFFVLALGSKEASVSLLPLLALLHLGLRQHEERDPVPPIAFAPFVGLWVAYAAFQYQVQQRSALIDSGLYSLDAQAPLKLLGSLGHALSWAWPILLLALFAAIEPGLRRRFPRRSILFRNAGLIAAALLCAMGPYALFRGGLLASRYFHLSSALLALASAPILAPLGRGSKRSQLVLLLGLAALTVQAVVASDAEVRRYQSAAGRTSRFIQAAIKLPSLDTPVLLVDSLLLGEQLRSAMRLFHPSGRGEYLAVERKALPPKWRPRSVFVWDPVAESFRPLPPPRAPGPGAQARPARSYAPGR